MSPYLLAVHSVEGEAPPSPEVMQAMYHDVNGFNAELQAKGAWVFAGGLHPVDTATVVRSSGGQVQLTDGPFAETKEHLGESGSLRRPISTLRWPGRPRAQPPAGDRSRYGHSRMSPKGSGGFPGRRARWRREDVPARVRSGRGNAGPPFR